MWSCLELGGQNYYFPLYFFLHLTKPTYQTSLNTSPVVTFHDSFNVLLHSWIPYNIHLLPTFKTALLYIFHYLEILPLCWTATTIRQNRLWALGFQRPTSPWATPPPVFFFSFLLRTVYFFLPSLVLAWILLSFPFFCVHRGRFISHTGHLLFVFIYCVFLIGFGQVSFSLFLASLKEMLGWGGGGYEYSQARMGQ